MYIYVYIYIYIYVYIYNIYIVSKSYLKGGTILGTFGTLSRILSVYLTKKLEKFLGTFGAFGT